MEVCKIREFTIRDVTWDNCLMLWSDGANLAPWENPTTTLTIGDERRRIALYVNAEDGTEPMVMQQENKEWAPVWSRKLS